MSLCCRERRQLRRIQAGLLASDSRLAAMLDTFGRRYRGQDMPASERVPGGPGRDRRAVTRIAVAVAVAALALTFLVSAALTTPARPGAPASGHRPPGPAAPAQAAQPATSPALPDTIGRHAGGPADAR
jgi:Protein of unknown function (DUF3040)